MRRHRPLASAARMGAWGRRGGAFGVAALAGNQEPPSDVQCLDSGLVDEDQEPLDELNSLTEDDLPNDLPSSDVALREIEEFLRQRQQDPGPNSGSDDPSDSA